MKGFQPPGRRRERILIVGFSGGGKSTCWLQIAEMLHKTKSESKMYVIDTDRVWEAMGPPDEHLDSIVKVYPAETYPQMKDAVKKIRAVAKPDDFLVFDMIDTLWSEAQNYFFDEAFTTDFEEFMVTSRKTGEGIGGDYGVNWQAINKLYAGVNDQLKRFPGHMIACTPGDTVKEANAKTGKGGEHDPNIVREFGRFKVKPVGQKKLRHDYHTILLAQDTPSGYTLTTLKERMPAGVVEGVAGWRANLVGAKTGDFALTYMVKVAGWKLA